MGVARVGAIRLLHCGNRCHQSIVNVLCSTLTDGVLIQRRYRASGIALWIRTVGSRAILNASIARYGNECLGSCVRVCHSLKN